MALFYLFKLSLDYGKTRKLFYQYDDFDGEFAGTNQTRHAGTKREFGDLDDDEDDIFGSKKAKSKVEETAPGVATGMILALLESLQSCKDDLPKSQVVSKWTDIVLVRALSCKVKYSKVAFCILKQPEVVVSYLHNLSSSEELLRDQLEKAKKKEAAFIVTIAKREQEVANLKPFLSLATRARARTHARIWVGSRVK
ncbi:FKBP12-interacting protein of 37 kDa-like [Rutidosis leptorrhynchoides]|uniref:FKBP12-interacting protein of 37 kDa-like n=1 Tax=Rutidosis leptorrhynchoides TaxID=125765 RepID=UPI003A9A0135